MHLLPNYLAQYELVSHSEIDDGVTKVHSLKASELA